MTAHLAGRARLRLVDPDLEPATAADQHAADALVASATLALDHATAAGIRLTELTDALHLRRELHTLERLLGQLETVLAATRLLAAGVELADRFPDGNPRPERPTPRQALYLADLAHTAATGLTPTGRPPAPTGLTPTGRPPARRCASPRADGAPCRAYALTRVDRAACRSHATDEERALNAEREAAWAAALDEEATAP